MKTNMNSSFAIALIFGVLVAIFLYTSGVFSYAGNQKDTIKSETQAQKINPENLKNAYFAGGCFWCMESIFEKQAGVEGAYVGYTGGSKETATYELTSAKDTQHREAVKVVYDPDIITYRKLVELFWTQINPTDEGGQFNDRGYVYSPAIFYGDTDEKIIAQLSRNNLEVSKRFDAPIATAIEPAKEFFLAEDYHQDYYKNNSVRYKVYTAGSGRKGFIEDNWSDRIQELEGKDYVNGQLELQKNNQKPMKQFTEEELREKLTPLQYSVTQEDGTEPAFQNKYWDNKKVGIYVDVIDGTPLYSSLDKFDSGTGWPSFTKSIDDNNIIKKTDTRFFMTRTAVDSATTGAHLGHIFNDAPTELGGIRHCINSASLRFVAVEDLDAEGYGEYKTLFQ